jgi:hypothetical protein
MLRERRVTPVVKPKVDPSLANPLRLHQVAFLEWTRAIGLAEQTVSIRSAALN